MFAFAIGLVVGIAVLARMLWWVYEDAYDGFEIAFFTIGAFVSAVCAAFLVFLGITVVANLAVSHDDEYRTVELVALRDGTGNEGHYVLGSGATISTGNYVFYHREGAGKRLVNIESSGVMLYEDTDKPYARQYLTCALSVRWLAPCFTDGAQFTELHVPPGSVVNNIDLDLNEN